MRTLLLATVLAIHSPLAFAKCGTKIYVLSGAVVHSDSRPAVEVLVGAAWKEDDLIGGPALARTDSNGRYSIPIVFHTYSSTPGNAWYECKGQLKEVAVSAYSDIHYAPPIAAPVSAGASKIEASPLELSFEISTGVPIEYGG